MGRMYGIFGEGRYAVFGETAEPIAIWALFNNCRANAIAQFHTRSGPAVDASRQ